jgi:hypothetical protein
MIEKPILTPAIFSDTENYSELLRRFRHRFRTVKNPLNQETVTTKQYRNYFKFTIVRNPWSRAVSWYKNVMRDEIHRESLNLSTKVSFNSFLNEVAGRGMLRPQTYWLKNFKGDIALDFIGRFENLENDFQKVCEELNIPDVSLPHRISGSNKDYRDFYDEESTKLIKQIYQEEIKMFNYSFESD